MFWQNGCHERGAGPVDYPFFSESSRSEEPGKGSYGAGAGVPLRSPDCGLNGKAAFHGFLGVRRGRQRLECKRFQLWLPLRALSALVERIL